MDNLNSISNRLFDCGQDDFFAFCGDAVEKLAPCCESQIEVMLLSALYMASIMREAGKPLPNNAKLIKITQDKEIKSQRDAVIIVQPQYVWRSFRIDFCLSVMIEGLVGAEPGKPFQFFVECDGHDFHERTKEQAERDRARDREIQAAGIPILRFTGREIFRNPFDCVVEILNFISGKVRAGA